jgi:hypothetical protein
LARFAKSSIEMAHPVTPRAWIAPEKWSPFMRSKGVAAKFEASTALNTEIAPSSYVFGMI